MREMANSAGDADREMSIIMDSLEYKINRFKETGTGIWQNLLDRGTVGKIVDFGTAILNVLDIATDKLGLLGSIIAGGAIAGLIKMITAGTLLSTLTKIGSVIKTFFVGSALDRFLGLGSAFSSWAPILAGIATSIGLIAIGVNAYKKAHPSLDSLKSDASAAKDEFDAMKTKVEEAKTRIKELQDLKHNGAISSAEQKELDNLEQQNQRYEEQLVLLERIAEYKQQKVVSKANEDAVKEFNQFMANSIRETDDYWDWSGYVGYFRNDSGIGGLQNAIDDYTSAKSGLDAAYARLKAYEIASYEDPNYDPEKDAKRLAEYQKDIQKQEANVARLADALSGFQEVLVEWRGQMTDETAIAAIDVLLDSIVEAFDGPKTKDSFDSFKTGLKDIGDDADAVINKFLKGEKLTESESKRLAAALDDMGISLEDASVYLARMASEMGIDSTAIDTSTSIANLVSLQDELQRTAADIEAYNKALEGGEKGDSAETYKSAWEKAREDIEAGRNDTRQVHAAASLIFGEKGLAGIGYDQDRITKEIQSNKMLQAVLGGEADIGLNFGNYLKDNAEQYAGLVDVMQSGDGSFDIAIHDFEGLAQAMGVSEGFLYSLADAMDAYGPQRMMDDADLKDLRSQFQDMNGDVGQLIDTLASQGLDGMDIISTLHQLDDAFGDINFGDEIYQQVAEAMDKLKTGDGNEENNVDIQTTVEDPMPQAEAYLKQLQELFAANPIVVEITTPDGESVEPGKEPKVGEKKIPTPGSESGAQYADTGTGEYKAVVEGLNQVAEAYQEVSEAAENATTKEQEFFDPNTTAWAQKQIQESTDLFNIMHPGGRGPLDTDYSKEITIEASSNAEEVADEAKAAVESVPDVTPNITAADNTGPGVGAAQGNLSSLPKKVVIPVIVSYGTSGSLPKNIGSYAAAGGTKDSPGGPTLVNELGPELISENGHAYIAGGGLPTVVNLSKGAIVLDAEDTQKALAGKKKIDGVIGAAARGIVKKPNLPDYTDTGTSNSNLTVGTSSNAHLPGGGSSGGSSGGGGNGGSGGKAAEKATEKVDWIEVAIDRLTKAVDKLNKVFESSFKTIENRIKSSYQEIEKMREGLDLYERGYTRYIEEANSVGLDESIAALVRDGTVDISKYDKKTKEKIDEYKQWYEKAVDCKTAIDDLHESLAQLYHDRFDAVQSDYEAQLDALEYQATMVEKDLDLVEKRGFIGSTSFYQTLTENETARIDKLKEELASLQSYFNEAMDSGEIERESEAWYEMQESINSVTEEIADANIQLVEYQNNIRELNWSYFDFAQERMSQLNDEAEFLIELMSRSDLFDDNGKIVSAGMATVGMRVLEYNTYMAQADEYAKEIERIERDLANDKYNKELIERREELIGLQQDSILAAESEKDAVRDLISDGIDKELSALKELIDAYGESLDSAKDLYEYQKKVTEKTSDIAALQKQLSAYSNDTSEETRAKVQKLNKELADAQRDLSETERDQSISEQKKLLSDLYDEYEEILNDRLDNVDALMAEMIEMTNANLGDIQEEIAAASEKVGYSITEGMHSVLYGQGFSNYDKTFEEISTVNDYLDQIYRYVAAMAGASGAVSAYDGVGFVDYAGRVIEPISASQSSILFDEATGKPLLNAAAEKGRVFIPELSGLKNKSFITPNVGIGRSGVAIGEINLGGIQIDHVQDYNEMLAQMRDDPKFEKLVNVMTLDAAVGKSAFRKNSIKF